MPRTALTVQTTGRVSNGLDSGTAMESADQANGMYFSNTGQNVVVRIVNGDVSSKTVTFTTAQSFDSLALPDLDVVVPAGEERIVGPFPNAQYGSGTSNTDVYVDFDSDTNVTLIAFKLGATTTGA